MSVEERPPAHEVLVAGPIGLIDAALVRYLESVKEGGARLSVHVTESLCAPLVKREHLELFLSALAVVDEVTSIDSGRHLAIPSARLQAYTVERVLKLLDVRSERCSPTAPKLQDIYALAERCRSLQSSMSTMIAVVAGSFDVLHPGHVCLMQQAKSHAGMLVVAMQSTRSLMRQPKNRHGDLPIYGEGDRVSLVAALSCVDAVVLFDDPDCLRVLDVLRPDYYVKHTRDRGRAIVEREASLVRGGGGQTIYIDHPTFGYASGALVEWIRRTNTPRDVCPA